MHPKQLGLASNNLPKNPPTSLMCSNHANFLNSESNYISSPQILSWLADQISFTWSEMGSSSKYIIAKQKLSIISLFFLSLSLFILTSTFRLKNRRILISYSHHRTIKNVYDSSSYVHDFIAREFQGNKEIKIGLVNIYDDAEELAGLGETSSVHFKRVSRGVKWDEILPQWVDEQEKWKLPKCPDIPMPVFEDSGEFDVIVSRVPCGNGENQKGIRDVFRLQVNLVVANLLARNGHKKGDDGRSVYVVFLGSCGPMWEIFRCDDLLRHEGEVWIYKPDLKRLKQKDLMPVDQGCQLGSPFVNQGKDLSKLYKPREAYVTVLHSSEAYVCGAIVLAQSIIKTNTTKDLVLLADDSISEKTREALKAVGWKIKIIERIESPFAKKNAYNRWNYSKLRIWQLTEYDKVMFIDSDLIVLKNLDKYFTHPPLSVAKDSNNFFNSGLMLIEPSECVFETLVKKRHTLFSYNGGDQGFLNEAFTWWNRWPTKLNHFKMIHQMKVNMTQDELFESSYTIHYFGIKPWMCYRDYDCNWDTKDRRKFSNDAAHSIWWKVHDAMPRKLQRFCDLSESMDLNIKKMREMARNGSFPDEHWKIRVMDPRQHI